MKILNLDKLAIAKSRELVIAGVVYPIQEMTVSNFIETTKAAKAVAGASIDEQIEATMAMAVRSVPTITVELLSLLSLEQLQSIVAFVRGDEVDGVEDTSVAPVVSAEEKKPEVPTAA